MNTCVAINRNEKICGRPVVRTGFLFCKEHLIAAIKRGDRVVETSKSPVLQRVIGVASDITAVVGLIEIVMKIYEVLPFGSPDHPSDYLWLKKAIPGIREYPVALKEYSFGAKNIDWAEARKLYIEAERLIGHINPTDGKIPDADIEKLLHACAMWYMTLDPLVQRVVFERLDESSV